MPFQRSFRPYTPENRLRKSLYRSLSNLRTRHPYVETTIIIQYLNLVTFPLVPYQVKVTAQSIHWLLNLVRRRGFKQRRNAIYPALQRFNRYGPELFKSQPPKRRKLENMWGCRNSPMLSCITVGFWTWQ